MGVLRGFERGKFGKGQGKRGRLSAKRGNANYVKGTGGTREGRHTKHGNYVMDPKLMMTLDVPDLTDFEVRSADDSMRPGGSTAVLGGWSDWRRVTSVASACKVGVAEFVR